MDIDDLAAGIVAGGRRAAEHPVGRATARRACAWCWPTASAADREVVRALPGVMSTVERGGQFQVVIGQHVGQVDTQVRSLVSAAKDGAPVDEAPVAMTPVDRAFDLLTGTFHPLLWALVGSSMIKTFLALAVAARLDQHHEHDLRDLVRRRATPRSSSCPSWSASPRR